MSFADLGLSPDLLKAIADVGYETPTPIQQQSIPWVLAGRDVLGIAQTGTGKTGSFTLPMIEILSQGRAKARMPRSLILAPTRELANQAAENFALYGKYHPLSMALLIGGESFGEQEKSLDRGVDVLIATPGRLLDMFERGHILLRDVKILVIDEADRMLDMGFIPDVEKIVSLLPPLRQTLFFSATMDPQILRLADAFLQNPKEIRIDRQATTAETVRQYLLMVNVRNKRRALRQILEQEDVRNAFIFCNRKRDVGVLYRSLKRHHFKVLQLHGDMVQNERTMTLASFKSGEVPLMVCSDVAARGLDVADVSHVFNFDVPIHAEDYVHRIGRTGRAGREGCAYTLATPEDARFIAAIEKLIGKSISHVVLEGIPLPTPVDEENPVMSLSEPERSPSHKHHDGQEKEVFKMDYTRDGSERQKSRNKGRRNHVAHEVNDSGRDMERDQHERRGGRRRNHTDRHSANWIPEMEYPDNVLAFGGYTPAFLLAPLTGTEVRFLAQKIVKPLSAPVVPPPADDVTPPSEALNDSVDASAETHARKPRPSRTRRRRSEAPLPVSAGTDSVTADPVETAPAGTSPAETVPVMTVPEDTLSSSPTETAQPETPPLLVTEKPPRKREPRRRKATPPQDTPSETPSEEAPMAVSPDTEESVVAAKPVRRPRRKSTTTLSSDNSEVPPEAKAKTKQKAPAQGRRKAMTDKGKTPEPKKTDSDTTS